MPYRMLAVAALFTAPALAAANVTLLAQQRTIDALTTFDNQTQTASATGFEPFVAAVSAETAFPRAAGGTGTNQAVASINCLVDPNAIRAAGSLAASGGVAVTGTQPSPVFGEAAATVIVSFQVDLPTVYHLTAAPRPSDDPRDEFELELSNLDTDVELFAIDERDPPQSVDATGTLQPGRYQVEYQVELTGDAAPVDAQYGMVFTLSSPCGAADIGGVGGQEGADNRLDNNDFIVFVDRFFRAAASADVGGVGGVAGGDGLLDNNDFVVFIDQFFGGAAGCV